MQPILDIELEAGREGLFPRAVMPCRMGAALLSTFSAAPSTYFSCLHPSGLGHLPNRTFGGIAEWHPCVEHRISWGYCHA